MCDYSLQSVKTRKAVVGDKLKTTNFGTGTMGFADANVPAEDRVAVCVLPGTEIAFADPVAITVTQSGSLYGGATFESYVFERVFKQTTHTLARFRQINREEKYKHHDALEFPDGTTVLLTDVQINQTATVLQLPAIPMDVEEAEEQRRVEYAG